MQRGRTPQFVFIRSRIKRAVVLVSTSTGLSSGTGGGFTVAHSVVMSLACTGQAESVARMARSAAARQQHSARYSMMPLQNSRPAPTIRAKYFHGSSYSIFGQHHYASEEAS